MNNLNNNVYRINSLSKIILFSISILSIYSGYLNTSMPVIILLFLILITNLFQIKLTFNQIIIIFILIIYIIIILTNTANILSALSNLKWFYGVIIFMLISKIRNVRLFFFDFLSSHKVFLIFLTTIIMESILLNFFLDPLYIYKDAYSSSAIGNYNRPLGGIGNSSATATFVVAWYCSLNFKEIRHANYIFYFYSFSILTLMSGTGFILYLASLIIRALSNFKIEINFSKFLFFTLVLIFSIFLYDLLSEIYIQKLSLTYLTAVLEEKILYMGTISTYDLDRLFSESNFEKLFGHTISSKSPLIGGDFGWIDLIYSQGILGFFVYALILLAFNSNTRKDRLTIIILFMGAFHYAAIFFVGGQFLLSKTIMKEK